MGRPIRPSNALFIAAVSFVAAIVGLAPDARAYDSIRFLDPISGVELIRPVAAAYSGERLIVVDEKKSALLIYDAAGKLVKSFGHEGNNPGEFRRPSGVAVGRTGRIYVADEGNDRVQIFDAEGLWIANIGQSQGFFDGKKKDGRLRTPEGVAISEDGTVYIADTGNWRIDAFSPDGVFKFSIGPKVDGYELVEPVALALDKAGFLYFVDKDLKRIFKCGPSGSLIASWDEGDSAGIAITVDPYGFIYVLDGEAGKVIEYSPAGMILGKFGSWGKGVGQMKKAQDLVVAPDGTLLVLDTGNARILRVQMTDKLKIEKIPLNSDQAKELVSQEFTAKVKAGDMAAEGNNFNSALTAYSNAMNLAAVGSTAAQELEEKALLASAKLDRAQPVSDKAKDLMALGKAFVAEAKGPEDYIRAIKNMNEALALSPWWSAGHFNIALAEEGAGRWSEAQFHLKIYLKLNPDAVDRGKVRQKIAELEVHVERGDAPSGQK